MLRTVNFNNSFQTGSSYSVHIFTHIPHIFLFVSVCSCSDLLKCFHPGARGHSFMSCGNPSLSGQSVGKLPIQHQALRRHGPMYWNAALTPTSAERSGICTKQFCFQRCTEERPIYSECIRWVPIICLNSLLYSFSRTNSLELTSQSEHCGSQAAVRSQ